MLFEPGHPLWIESERIDEIVARRRSCRAFVPGPARAATVRSLLRAAARAPSGGNLQPWQAYLLERPAIDRVATAIRATGVPLHQAEWDDYRYFPRKPFGVYGARLWALGRALYRVIGIKRRVGRLRHEFERGHDFYGAPLGVLITIDRRLEQGSWIDLGMFIQTFVLLAEAHGLGTCVQASFAPYHRALRPVVGIGDEEVLVCGIAVGHPDWSAPINAIRTTRAPEPHWLRHIER